MSHDPQTWASLQQARAAWMTQRASTVQKMLDAATAEQQWTQLSATLAATDPKVTTAKSAWDAAVAALSAARDGERKARTAVLNNLTAWVDADPASDVSTLSAAYPIALFPVRLETRFVPPLAPSTLRLRIFPDSIQSDTHEPELTDNEGKIGDAYWSSIAAGVAPAEAWRRVLLTYPAQRAVYLVQATNPASVRPPRRASTWTRPAETRVLPDRWMVVAYRGGVEVARAISKPIQEPLALTISPLMGTSGDAAALGNDPDLGWAADFTAAVSVGMAVEIPLSPYDAQVGFDRVVVVGVKASLDPGAAADQLATLWRNHSYASGVAFVPQGSPTNNTGDAPAAYPLDDPNGTVSFALQAQAVPPAGTDGRLFTDALGLPSSIAAPIAAANRSEQIAARMMNTVVWSSTFGYYLRELLAPGFDGPTGMLFPPQTIADARAHFQTFVRGRGPLPAFRVGTTPYGVLPVTSLRHWTGAGTAPASALDLISVIVRAATPTAPETDHIRVGHAIHAPANGLYTALETGTPLAQTPAWYTFATGPASGASRADLYVIQQTANASGNIEYSVLTAGSRYGTIAEHGTLPIANNANYAFALADWDNDGNPDLFAINRQGASTTEISILSGASHFQTVIFQGTTGLPQTDHNWSFGLADWDKDGIPDLVVVQTGATASQHVEVHVFSGASKFKTEILKVDTGLALKVPVDVSVADWDGDRIPDIVLAYRAQPVPTTLTVTVLRGDQGWQSAYPDLQSNLADVDPVPGLRLLNPSGAFVVAADWDGDGRAELIAVRNDGSIVTGAIGVQVLSASPVMQFTESASLADPNRGTRTTVASTTASFAGDGSVDLVVVQAQSQAAGTDLTYRIARKLDPCGVPARYVPDNATAAGPTVGAGLVGAGVAVADLDRDGNRELVVFHVDASTGITRGSYRIGWKLDAKGVADHWSADVAIPYATRFLRPPAHLGGSMTLADLDGSGQPDMLVLSAERSAAILIGIPSVQSLYYVVGKNLDATGQVTGGWGNPISVPFTIGANSTLGVAGIAVKDLDGNGLLDVVVAFVEISGASRTTWYRIGRRLDASGIPKEWSDQFRAPGTDGTVVAGISLAHVSQGGWIAMLRGIVEHAKPVASFVPRIGASTDTDGDMLQALALHASSPQVGIRRIVGPNTIVNLFAFAGADTMLPGSDWTTWYQRVQRRARDLLSTLGDPVWNSARNALWWQPRMSDALVESGATVFNQPLVAPEPLSESSSLPVINGIPNYLGWLLDLQPVHLTTSDMALDNVTTRIDSPWPLLFYLARHSLLLEYASAAFAIDVVQRGANAAEDQDPEMFGVVPGAPVRTVWNRLLNTMPSSPGSSTLVPVWQYLFKNGPIYSAQVTELRIALRYLSNLPTAELDRLVSETLDTCSHRVDAWATSLATRRLQTEMRPAQPTGLHLGAFGWLERVVPTARNRFSSQIIGHQQVLVPKQGGGYIHAPSAAMASTAAVLRNAYMTRGGSSTVYAIDLSSERARIGRELLDAVRQGVSLGAALGFRIERILESNNLQRYIDPLRALCPLVAQHDGVAQTGSTSGRMMLDGLKLRAMWPNLPWTTGPFVNAQQPLRALLNGELGAAGTGSASWTDPLDCVADLVTAESVYQTIRGNKVGAVAALDALSQGTRPPEPEILRQPRSGISLTHRVAAILGDPAPALANWPAATPRGAADPHVDAWVGSMLGNPQQVRCRVAVRSHDRPPRTTQLGEITLVDLNLRPLDVLQLARTTSGTTGASGASELDRRIAWAAVNLPAAQGSTPDDVSITYSRDPAWAVSVRSFPELLELARSINAAVGRSRPLTPSDLLPPDATALALKAPPMAGDAPGRASDLGRSFNTAISNLQNAVNATAPSTTALAIGLAALSLFNLPAAVPRSTDVQGLLTQAQSVLETASTRKREASKFIGKLTSTTGWDAVDIARDAVQAILGGDLTFVVGFSAVETQTGELAQAMAAEAQLLASSNLAKGEPVRRWLAGAARVRPALDLWRRVALYRTAQGAGARSWTVAQLPYRSGDSWLALESGATPRAGVVSLVLDRVVTPQAGSSCAGLLLDEWAEVIPASTATTAVAMHYESPSAQAPQTILLAVPPSLGGNWNLEVLLSVVNETLDLTHVRATDGSLSGSLGQFLPAVLLATNVAGDTVSTDFRTVRRAE